MADLPSILGGMAQGFLDFGKSAVDLFGTGGASIADLIESARTGKVTTKNSDDFRKWLYDTNDVKDAAAKGLGTALNGVQTVSDYIPGIGAVTRSPLFNAGQGALGGLADEFKMYGKDYDLGRAGQRAAVSAGGALASTGLADALKGSGNALLKSGTAQGLARGAVGGAISGGGYAAIDGGDVLDSAAKGAGMGALLGGTMGALQDFRPAKATSIGLTDDERQARIANAQQQIDDIGPVRRFTDDPDELAKRARVNELQDAIKAYQGGFDTVDDYNAAMAAKRANRKPYTPPEAQYQPKIGEDMALNATQAPEGYTRLYRGLENEFDPKYVPQVSDNGYGYESWSDNYDLAREYAGPNGNIYSVDVPNNRIADQVVTPDGERMPVVMTDKKAGMRSFDGDRFVDGKEYLLNVNDPLRQELTYSRVMPARTLDATLADAAAYDSTGQEVPQRLAERLNGASPMVRDENGNLVRFYHGTPNGDFDSPRGGSYFTTNREYADVYQSPNASSISYGKQATNPATYEAYLDLKKPFDLSDPEARRIYIDEYVKGGNATGINPYLDNYDDVNSIDWMEVEGLKEYLQGTPYGYDSIIADEGGVPDGNGGVISRGKSYIPFEDEQVVTLKKNLARPLEQTLSADDMAVNNPQPKISRAAKASGSLENTLSAGDRAINDYESLKHNGMITDDMRKRAAGVIKMGESGIVPENELYNRIDPSTLPEGHYKTGKLLDEAYEKGADIKKITAKTINDEFAKKFGDNPDKDALIDYLFDFADDDMKKVAKSGSSTTKLSDMAKTKLREEYFGDGITALASGDKTVRNGYTGALDTVLSERLGIAPGNTYKKVGTYDDLDSLGLPASQGRTEGDVSNPGLNNIMVAPTEPSKYEEGISAMGHERLHSFQNEAKTNGGRYSDEVNDAYKELAKDLKKAGAYKNAQDIKAWWGEKVPYYRNRDEQEARMLQQYLFKKGYTGQPGKMSNKVYHNPSEFEFDDAKIAPAFDKFVDKLRDMSRRGIALPALTALFGGGALMSSQQKDKEEVK